MERPCPAGTATDGTGTNPAGCQMRTHRVGSTAKALPDLTLVAPARHIRGMPPMKLQRLDPERRRRRLQLLAELSDAKALRDRVAPRRAQVDRLRELIATRRRREAV
ncbi:hypothetical protein Athai_59240 [Actinocatenispora thailandica]|uniref:Uncharacterized protein n=1 Tax=Actinocatenispora thailandica TaxID=227318 RepID=A0A7R7I0C0_9ACTN|nr:hypothetical protein Athai_59240 [Actinocatenispora thailandica]